MVLRDDDGLAMQMLTLPYSALFTKNNNADKIDLIPALTS